MDPKHKPPAANERPDARRTTDARTFDYDPENPHAGAERDRWLRENVPPHHE